LEELGGRVDDVVRTRQYVVRADLADAVGAVHGEVFGDVRPASTMVVVAGLLDPRWLVEVELDAVVG
jgi:enamine deaminase RidA (YjgF/YER057c/UK114 family)